VTITEIEAKSILRKRKKIDSWFLSYYGMNLYRGCTHNCVYCDGRSEGYYVEGEFGDDVTVKVNAIEILRREVDPKRKRTPFKQSYVMLGGGVGDCYQPAEQDYRLSRKTLQLLLEHNFPVHILTKSTLVKRDVDVLKKINEKTRAIVSFSFSTADNEISAIFEPGVPSPAERLKTISFFKKEGIACGMFLLPVIPFVTDTPERIAEILKQAVEAGVDFVNFGGMTLKEGKQKEYFFNTLNKHYPELTEKYEKIYTGSKWGTATGEYYDSINKVFKGIAGKYKIPVRISPTLFENILSENDKVVVILEHIDYLIKLKGRSSSFRYAAYTISQLKEPLSTMKGTLHTIKGISKTPAGVIREILETGSSSLLENLLY